MAFSFLFCPRLPLKIQIMLSKYFKGDTSENVVFVVFKVCKRYEGNQNLFLIYYLEFT